MPFPRAWLLVSLAQVACAALDDGVVSADGAISPARVPMIIIADPGIDDAGALTVRSCLGLAASKAPNSSRCHR